MTNTSRRRRRIKDRSVGDYAQKYRSLLIGAFLIIVGLGSTMYSFDYKPDVGGILDWSRWKDLGDLWPFIILIIGFIFIIYDYIKNSSKKRYK